jgi:valyl-tRNA synthetase
LKLVKIWDGRKQLPGAGSRLSITGNQFALLWFDNRLNQVRTEVELLMKQFRLSEALKTIYSLVWDDFCSWYLEWVKPGFEELISGNVYDKTLDFFEELLQLLHPFMPFITEEIYHLLKDQNDDLIIKQFKKTGTVDQSILEQGNILKESITTIRDSKNKNQVKPKEKIKLSIQSANQQMYNGIDTILAKQINAESIEFTKDTLANRLTVMVNKDKFYIETERVIESGFQKDQLLKDLEYLKGFLNSVERKLNNEKFVQNAKADVIELERKKKADAEIKIQVIEESLSSLN